MWSHQKCVPCKSDTSPQTLRYMLICMIHITANTIKMYTCPRTLLLLLLTYRDERKRSVENHIQGTQFTLTEICWMINVERMGGRWLSGYVETHMSELHCKQQIMYRRTKSQLQNYKHLNACVCINIVIKFSFFFFGQSCKLSFTAAALLNTTYCGKWDMTSPPGFTTSEALRCVHL